MNWIIVTLIISAISLWTPVSCSGKREFRKRQSATVQDLHDTYSHIGENVKIKRSSRPHKSRSAHSSKDEEKPDFLDSIISHAVAGVIQSMTKETKGKLDSLNGKKVKEPNEKRNIPLRPQAATSTTTTTATAVKGNSEINNSKEITKRNKAQKPDNATRTANNKYGSLSYHNISVTNSKGGSNNNNNHNFQAPKTVNATRREMIASDQPWYGFTSHEDLPDPFEGSETPVAEYTYKINPEASHNSPANENGGYQESPIPITNNSMLKTFIRTDHVREFVQSDENPNDESVYRQTSYGKTDDELNRHTYNKNTITSYHHRNAPGSDRKKFSYLNLDVFARKPSHKSTKNTTKAVTPTTNEIDDKPNQNAVIELDDDRNKETDHPTYEKVDKMSYKIDDKSALKENDKTNYKEGSNTAYKEINGAEYSDNATPKEDKAASKEDKATPKEDDNTAYKNSKETEKIAHSSGPNNSNKNSSSHDTSDKEIDVDPPLSAKPTSSNNNNNNNVPKTDSKYTKNERSQNSTGVESDTSDKNDMKSSSYKESDNKSHKEIDRDSHKENSRTADEDAQKSVNVKESKQTSNTLDLNEAVSDMQAVINAAFGKNASVYKHLSDYEVIVEKSGDNKKHININEPDFSVSIALNSTSSRDKNINTLRNVIKMLNSMKFKETMDTKDAINEPGNVTERTERSNNTLANGTKEEPDFSYIVHGGDVYKVIKMNNGEKGKLNKVQAATGLITAKEKQIITNLLDVPFQKEKSDAVNASNVTSRDSHVIMHEQRDSEKFGKTSPLKITKFKDGSRIDASSSTHKNMKDLPVSRGHTSKYHKKYKPRVSNVTESENVENDGDRSARTDDDLLFLQPSNIKSNNIISVQNKNRKSDKVRFTENEDQAIENEDQAIENADQAIENEDKATENEVKSVEEDTEVSGQKERISETSSSKLQRESEETQTGEAISTGEEEEEEKEEEEVSDILRKKPYPSEHRKQQKQGRVTSYYVKQNGKHFKVEVLSKNKHKKPSYSLSNPKDGEDNQESKMEPYTELDTIEEEKQQKHQQQQRQQQQRKQQQKQKQQPQQKDVYEIKHNNKIYRITQVLDKNEAGHRTVPNHGNLLGSSSITEETAANLRPVISMTGVSRTASLKEQQASVIRNYTDNNINTIVEPSRSSTISVQQTPNLIFDPTITTKTIQHRDQQPVVNMLQYSEAVNNNNNKDYTKQNFQPAQGSTPSTSFEQSEIPISGFLPTEPYSTTSTFFPTEKTISSELLAAENSNHLVPYSPNQQISQDTIITPFIERNNPFNARTNPGLAPKNVEQPKQQLELSNLDAKYIAHLEKIIRKDPPSIMHESASIMQQSRLSAQEKHKIQTAEQKPATVPQEQLVRFNYAPSNLSSNAAFTESFNKTLFEEVML